MNLNNCGLQPPFFHNGSCPRPNLGVIPTNFSRPPPPFPPPNLSCPPPGYNGFNTGPPINNLLQGNCFYHPNRFNLNNNKNLFSSPPPPFHRPNAPRPPRPSFTQDTIFSPPSNNTIPSNQECFPFNGSQQKTSQNFQSAVVADNARGRGQGLGDWRGRGRGGFVNNRPTQCRKKKEKVDKRDLAENNAFFCDTCDRGFKTEEKYQEHVDGHMKCSYKDCPFIAAPKLVHLHIALQHRSGLAKKVWSIESEEDVKKWREERKRKFPTAANIAKKKEEATQKIARGEVLQTKDFSDRGRGRGRGRGGRGQWRGQNRQGRGRGGRFHHSPNNSFQEESEKVSEGEDSSDSDNDLPPTEVAIEHSIPVEEAEHEKFKGSQEFKEVVEEIEPQHQESVLEAGPPNTTSLGLLASYDYSSSDNEEEEKEERMIEQPHGSEKQLSGQVRIPEEHFELSPSKRPRLLPNPFLLKNSSTQSIAKPVEIVSSTVEDKQPGGTVLSPNNTTNPQSEHVLKAKETSSKHPNYAEVLRKQDCHVGIHSSSENNKNSMMFKTTSPNKLREIDNQNGLNVSSIELMSLEKADKCENHQSSQRGVEATDPEPLPEAAGKSLSLKKSNTAEDMEMEERKKHQNGSRGSRKTGINKHQAKKHKPVKIIGNPHTYTLLEKLLAPDIRRERNKILQCVHFIVKNKFFYPTSDTAASPSSTP